MVLMNYLALSEVVLVLWKYDKMSACDSAVNVLNFEAKTFSL